MQPWHTTFPIWNQSVVLCLVLTVASRPAYRSLKRQVRWFGMPISFRIFHTVKGFGIVNEAEIDVFLELSCFFHDPADVGNLISGSSAFSKTSLNIWKFTVHILLKPGLENFEHYFTSCQQLWPIPTSSNTHWTPVTLCCLLVALSRPPLWDPMDCSPLGSSVLPPPPVCLTKEERQELCTDYTWPLERIWFKRLFSRKGSQIVF